MVRSVSKNNRNWIPPSVASSLRAREVQKYAIRRLQAKGLPQHSVKFRLSWEFSKTPKWYVYVIEIGLGPNFHPTASGRHIEELFKSAFPEATCELRSSSACHDDWVMIVQLNSK